MSRGWLLFPAIDESPVGSLRFGYSRSSWEPDVVFASVAGGGRRIERCLRIAAPVGPPSERARGFNLSSRRRERAGHSV